MAGVEFNISKGREVEFYNRVKSNDPANSALIMMIIATGSAGGLSGFVDFDTFATVLAGGYSEVTNAGYSRKTLTDASLSAWAPDDTNNRVLLTLPLQTFATITAGNNWDFAVIGYDPDTTSGTDTTIVPISASELRVNGTAMVPAGDNLNVDFSSGWIMAT
jgi:hypothetical protein